MKNDDREKETRKVSNSELYAVVWKKAADCFVAEAKICGVVKQCSYHKTERSARRDSVRMCAYLEHHPELL